MTLRRSFAALALIAILLASVDCSTSIQAQDRPLTDLRDMNLNVFGVKEVPARKDPKTGFIVGGKNTTDLIKSLTEINGRKIADLEADMRPDPHDSNPVRSRAGFLGPDEKLLDVLAGDNRYVVDEMGLTHQDLAIYLRLLPAAGHYSSQYQDVLCNGRKFAVRTLHYKGGQLSPFLDGMVTTQDAQVKNLENGKELEYSLLVPQMIERYGFYEGKGTRYRVEPRQVLAVLDFLRKPEEGENIGVGPAGYDIFLLEGASATVNENGMPRWRKIALTIFAIAVIAAVVLLEVRYRGNRPNSNL